MSASYLLRAAHKHRFRWLLTDQFQPFFIHAIGFCRVLSPDRLPSVLLGLFSGMPLKADLENQAPADIADESIISGDNDIND